ncbi:MAG: hypothetical protein ACNA7J_07155 [Wenzhouxiangella sp.]
MFRCRSIATVTIMAALLAASAPGMASENGPAPVMGTYLPLLDGHEHSAQCTALPAEHAHAIEAEMRLAKTRPLRRPDQVARRESPLADAVATGTFEDAAAGVVPADYINPVTHVKDVGHLFHEIEIEVTSPADHLRLAQVLSFDAPDWARYMLVEFTPDRANQRAGLFLRPHNPFVEGVFQTPGQPTIFKNALQEHAFRQAAYRSENSRFDGMTQYVLVTRDMDPAPAGTPWHIALGQVRDDRPVSGTLRVWFSGSDYRAPLAIQFFYDEQERIDEVGFFDPTPRVPDGDNPGTTQGEAMRWILFQAADELLRELAFDGMFPIRVTVRTTDNANGPTGVASSNTGVGWIAPKTLAPGRLRARADRARLAYIAPLPVFEREAGTDACRAAPGELDRLQPRCSESEIVENAGMAGTTNGWIRLLRDFEGEDGSFWRWDKNLNDRAGGANIVNLIKHELMHVIGFTGPEKSQAYVATFDPPRLLRDAPEDFDRPENHGVWILTGTRQHHYGPIASPSPHNPWRDTVEPGPRLQDDNRQDPSHLMPEGGDELASWAPQADYMRPGGSGFRDAKGPGVAADILADVGYARGTWSIQDRRLPRQWFDRSRSGHGIDMRRIERADGSMVHFLHFYTYDANGEPEWYLAAGDLQGVVFDAPLHYVTYADGREPRQQVDESRSGRIRINLDPPVDHPVCESVFQADDSVWLAALVEWELPGESDAWCVEPIEFGDLPAFPVEASGSWFAGDDDTGWGFSLLTRNRGPRPITNAIVYYYDAVGDPTWSWGVTGSAGEDPYGVVATGVELEMLHLRGFCRTCAPRPVVPETNGHLRLRLEEPSMDLTGRNWIESMEVEDLGPFGGRWARENIEIRLLSSPHPEMFQ